MKVKRVVFPCDQPNWCRVQALLRQLKERCLQVQDDCDLNKLAQFHQEIYDINSSIGISEKGKKPLQKCILYEFIGFLQTAMDARERSRVVHVILPFVIDTALQIQKHVPQGGLTLLEQQIGKTVELSRKLVASIVACAFLCVFPERVRDRTAKLNFINFTLFFDYLTSPSQCAKLRSVLHYFDRLRDLDGEISGAITFTRQVMDKEELPTLDTWLTCDNDLCDLVVNDYDTIENAGCDTLQISFANSFIGGGVLLHGKTQEELRFSMCPELLSALLFTERMLDNEAILVKGFEQFSEFSGYGSSLAYAGNHVDEAERDQYGNLQTALCSIDAVSFKLGSSDRQYRDTFLLRDLNKAMVGFRLCEERYNTLKPSRSAAKLEQSSSEEDYQTASESLNNEASQSSSAIPPALLNFSCDLGKDILPMAIKEAMELEHRAYSTLTDHKDDDQNPLDRSYEIDDLHQACNSSSSSSHLAAPELLGVDLDGFLSDDRRRSSNLSDLASRRSSSSTSKHSSEFSSEFEEYYESFQKSERHKHDTIKEEVGPSMLNEFANILAIKLLYEGSTTAAQLTPGVQTFDSIPYFPSSLAQKPTPVRQAIPEVSSYSFERAQSDSGEINASVVDNTDAKFNEKSVSDEVIEKFAAQMVENLVLVAAREVGQFSQERENNNVLRKVECPVEADILGNLNGNETLRCLLAAGEPMATDYIETSSSNSTNSTIVDYANSLSKLILNMALEDLAKRSGECSICKDSSSSSDLEEFATRVVQVIIKEANSEGSPRDDGSHIGDREVTQVKMGMVLAEKIVHEIMSDFRRDFQSTKIGIEVDNLGNFSFDKRKEHITSSSFRPTDTISTTSLGQYNLLAEKLLNSCFESAKGEIEKACRSGSKKAKIVDIGETVSIEFPYDDEEARMKNYAQAFTDSVISDACYEFNRGRLLNSHSRRSSEPSRKTSSIQAFIGGYQDKHSLAPNSRRDHGGRRLHNNLSMDLTRWHSTDEVGQRKGSQGFRDEMLSSFEVLLRQSNLYIPNMDLVQNKRRDSLQSDRGSSRRSSGFRDNLLASFEEELIFTSAGTMNTSFSSATSGKSRKSLSKSSASVSPRSNPDCSASTCPISSCSYPHRTNSMTDPDSEGFYIEDVPSEQQKLSDIPTTKIFLVEEMDLLNAAVSGSPLDHFAGSLAGSVLHGTMVNSSEEPFEDASHIPYQLLVEFADPLVSNVLSAAMIEAAATLKSRQVQDCKTRMRRIATGNWGCGMFRGDPQLKAMIQWMAASWARAPTLLYFTFMNNQVKKLQEVRQAITARGWKVKDLMRAVQDYCERMLEEREDQESTSCPHLFDELLTC